MRGSLALWYESDGSKVEGHKPRIELHFNIWRDLPKEIKSVFDFGILFRDSWTIQRLFIAIPATLKKSQIRDLSKELKQDTTLSAVFNDTFTVGQDSVDGQAFEVKRQTSDSPIVFFVCSLDSDNDIELKELRFNPEDTPETVISLTNQFFKRLRNQVGDHYVRLRIPLNGDLLELFVKDVAPSDRFLLSSFDKAETIEFRLNEKRNFSRALRLEMADKNMEIPTIEAIHYFLIRDLQVEMTQAHMAFRKMRSLEPRLWKSYLEGLGSEVPDNMIIYHWRALAEKTGQSIEDFQAFATFRKGTSNIWLYVPIILFFGALGSTIQSLLSAVGSVSV